MQSAWRSLWVLRRQHEAPLWARLLAAMGVGATLALVLMSITAVFGTVQIPNWWMASVLPNIAICMIICTTLLLTLRLAECVLAPALLERMSNLRDLRAGVGLGAVLMFGIILGMTIGFTVIPPLVGSRTSRFFISLPAALTKFAVFLMVVLAINGAWLRSRLRQKEALQEAAEAQLRLLQGQIEPHFLFNTLANVQSLMDHDAARAKAMLEAFSDYLRAGLTQLRLADSTLGAELAMAQTYLELMQIRMQERLTFTIDASAAARAAGVPTLLLQPLVENAIHHGLEPKVEGGHVGIRAELRDGRLEVCVADNGMGLDAPRRALRAGTGMALSNLRARLQTRYGGDASLTLAQLDPGASATVAIPSAAAA